MIKLTISFQIQNTLIIIVEDVAAEQDRRQKLAVFGLEEEKIVVQQNCDKVSQLLLELGKNP